MVIPQGSPIPVFMRAVIAIVGLLGIFMYPFGLILTVACLCAFLYTGGVEIDPTMTKIREYSSLFGARWGAWKPLANYKYIAFLQTKRTGTVQGRAGGQVGIAELDHDVVLLDESHRRKFLVKACKSMDEAREIAKQITEMTKFPLVRYAPQRTHPGRR